MDTSGSSTEGGMAGWGLPIPVRKRSEHSNGRNQSAAVMPPLPPPDDLSIFDDIFQGESSKIMRESGEESKSDSDEEGFPGISQQNEPHPDDVLQGQVLRTEEVMESKARADSFYLVYSPKSSLVKIGITLCTYEECKQKFTKVYGALDVFHYLKIENDMTRERLERAFYQFFSETRMFPGKPFFHPVDAQNRPMIPLYHALLSQLTTSDIRSIRRFYLQHGITALAAREWVEAQHQLLGGPSAAVELTPEEKKQLSEQRLLSTAAAEALLRSEQHYRETEGEKDDDHHNDYERSEDELEEEELYSSNYASVEANRLLAPKDTPVSLYLVHSVRSDLVKIGITTGTYEECRNKYTTLYGHLDDFQFMTVDNDLLCARETRLECLLYRLFDATRITPHREFFRPRDPLGREMVPVYTLVMRVICSPDSAMIKRWYAQHRSRTAMQAWIDAQLTANSSGGGSSGSLPAGPHVFKTPASPPLARTRKPVPSSASNSSQSTHSDNISNNNNNNNNNNSTSNKCSIGGNINTPSTVFAVSGAGLDEVNSEQDNSVKTFLSSPLKKNNNNNNANSNKYSTARSSRVEPMDLEVEDIA